MVVCEVGLRIYALAITIAVLKAQKKEQEAAEKANEITLEDFLEVERHRLGSNLTPVTAESFEKWKKERMEKKAAEEEAQKKKKETQAAANKVAGLSGRELVSEGWEKGGAVSVGKVVLTSVVSFGCWSLARSLRTTPSTTATRVRRAERTSSTCPR